jgi:hypothetical protein
MARSRSSALRQRSQPERALPHAAQKSEDRSLSVGPWRRCPGSRHRPRGSEPLTRCGQPFSNALLTAILRLFYRSGGAARRIVSCMERDRKTSRASPGTITKPAALELPPERAFVLHLECTPPDRRPGRTHTSGQVAHVTSRENCRPSWRRRCASSFGRTGASALARARAAVRAARRPTVPGRKRGAEP